MGTKLGLVLLLALGGSCSSTGTPGASPAADGGSGDDTGTTLDGSPLGDSAPTSDVAVPDTGPSPTSLASSVTDRGGVTWTFSQAVPVGQYVTGDWFVVGSVTVTGISPAPDTAAPYKNGSVKNLPTATGHSAWDQRLNDGTDQSWFFDPSFRLTT